MSRRRGSGIVLTEIEKRRFRTWVIENVGSHLVPSDEGLGGALVYNIVHAIQGDGKLFAYRADQFDEIELLQQEQMGRRG